MSDTLNQRYEAAGYSFPSDWLVDDYHWEIGKRAVDAADAAVNREAAVAAIPSWLIEFVPYLAEEALVDLIVDAALGRQSNE